MPTYRFHSLEEFEKIARDKGGECLSKEYVNYTTPLRFRCSRGHEFEQMPAKILQRGDWCRRCGHLDSNRLKLTIEMVDRLARKRGGRCLSTVYKGANSPLKWRCGNGHEWMATPNGLIYRGRWCGECARNKRLGIKDCRDAAKKYGGTLLSTKYCNKESPLEWQCSEGHKWIASLGDIRNAGRWCPTCGRRKAGLKRRLEINEVRRLAESRGGEFLSDVYSGNQVSYKWRCLHKHEWKNSVSNIKAGQWCPVCQSGYSERCVRLCFEALFVAEFPKKRPSWLRNEKGRLLELDGFNEDLGIAFEHQGRQHSEMADIFYRGDKKALERRIYLDQRKKKLCRENGVSLICVPQLDDLLLLKDLKAFVIRACAKAGIPLSESQKRAEPDYAKAFKPSKVDWIERLGFVAGSMGGRCLSEKWLGWRVKYSFVCKRDHIWDATPGSILHQKSWCKRCASMVQVLDVVQ
jgi:hypothetical protein